MKLDDRWGTGYWKSDNAPPTPLGLCDACKRRSAWLVIGGDYQADLEAGGNDKPDYLDLHPVYVCSWCKPAFDPSKKHDKTSIDRALADAKTRSISWRWRWVSANE